MAAVGSFLDARSVGGRWLVRMEDLDAPRLVPGSDAEILRCLESLGLRWDGPVHYQSRHTERYVQALETLAAHGLLYPCSCPRSAMAAGAHATYPGTCRNGPTRRGPTALRFRVDDDAVIRLEDRLQGPCEWALGRLGDVVVKRRDGIPAYQLAVVVDDAAQAVTSVVRGADLLASTAWQVALSQALGLPRVSYAHLPLVVEPSGAKLAKSRRSVAVDPSRPGAWLARALELLGHPPPRALIHGPPRELLAWAIDHWRPQRLRHVRTVDAPLN